MSYPRAVLTIVGDMQKIGPGLVAMADRWTHDYPDMLAIHVHSADPEFVPPRIQYMSADGTVKPIPDLMKFMIEHMDDKDRQELYEMLHRRYQCRMK